MEKELLGLIEHNAKMTVEEIAEELVADPNEVVSLIAELETKKVICGYDTIINWDKVTEEKCNALIEVKVTPQEELALIGLQNVFPNLMKWIPFILCLEHTISWSSLMDAL